MSVVDGDGFVALLSWKPTVPHSATPTARAVKIVVDCSGSMNGDSITQARIALRGILQKLRANDFFDIVRFGSRPQVLFGRLEPASGACLQRALTLAASLDADLGGTEIGDALSAAFAIATPGDAPPADILLITDGEVHATDPVITGARRSGHRVFTIGVGSTVAEAFVRQLAEQTGGACELVTPNEEMPARIVRHFQRIFLPRITELRIAWPRTPLRQPPVESRGIFEGDTVHAFAWLPGPATGQVGVEAKLEDGRTIRDAVQLISPPTPATHADAPGHPLARLAAAAWVGAFPEDTEAMALRYQLLTDRTDFLITHVRAENAKATQLPALRTVPQMLAAGWGGAGSVLDRACLPAACRIDASRAGAGFAFMDVLCAADMDLPLSAGRLKADHWAAQLGHLLHWNAVTQQLDDCTLALLERAGVPDELVHALRRIVDDSIDEAAIVLAFLAALAKSAVGQALDRQAKRVIAKAMQGRPTDPALSTRVSSVVSAVLLLGNPSPVE
jgi:Ca-activated chloride channel family protein